LCSENKRLQKILQLRRSLQTQCGHVNSHCVRLRIATECDNRKHRQRFTFALGNWVALGRVWWWAQNWAQWRGDELSVSAPVDRGDTFSRGALIFILNFFRDSGNDSDKERGFSVSSARIQVRRQQRSLLVTNLAKTLALDLHRTTTPSDVCTLRRDSLEGNPCPAH
jgi:hypothetical protein